MIRFCVLRTHSNLVVNCDAVLWASCAHKQELIEPVTRLWRFFSRFSRVADGGLNWESNSRFKMEDPNELIEH